MITEILTFLYRPKMEWRSFIQILAFCIYWISLLDVMNTVMLKTSAVNGKEKEVERANIVNYLYAFILG